MAKLTAEFGMTAVRKLSMGATTNPPVNPAAAYEPASAAAPANAATVPVGTKPRNRFSIFRVSTISVTYGPETIQTMDEVLS